MRGIKGIIRILLTAVLMGALFALPVYCEETETPAADTMRLEKTEGEVEVENASGRSVTLREGGKLYSGYKVTTREGYAWISLDQDKLIKLDWDTQVTVKKTGAQYVVMLEYGKIFFDVEKPLEEDESLDIRISTLSTGVRGTIGVVESQPKLTGMNGSPLRYASVELLEGKVLLAFYPLEGESLETRELTAGTLAALESTQAGNGEIAYLPLSELTLTQRSAKTALEENPFALMEFVQNPALSERVIAGGGLTQEELDDLVNRAEELLKEKNDQDSDQRREEEAAREEALPSQPVTDPVFENPEATPSATPTATPRPGENGQKPIPTATPTVTPAPTASPAGGGEDEPEDKPSQPVITQNTVVFKYGDKQFAQEEVNTGSKVEEPLIRPTAQGAWSLGGKEYDFSQPVKSDLTLVWRELP